MTLKCDLVPDCQLDKHTKLHRADRTFQSKDEAIKETTLAIIKEQIAHLKEHEKADGDSKKDDLRAKLETWQSQEGSVRVLNEPLKKIPEANVKMLSSGSVSLKPRTIFKASLSKRLRYCISSDASHRS